MGQAHEGSQALVIAPGTRAFSVIASPNVLDLVRSERSEVATLPKLASESSLDTSQTWNGAAAERIRVLHEHLPHAQFVQLFGDSMQARYPGATLAGEPRVEDDRVNNVVTVAAVYNVPQLAIGKDGNWLVRFSPTNLKGTLLANPSSNRKAPLMLPGFPFEGRYSFEVKFPGEVSAIADPHTSSVQSKQFNYTVTSSFRGNTSKTVIDLKTFADRVELADLKDYSGNLRKADSITRGFVLVTKDEIKSNSASVKKDFAQILRDRMQERVNKFTEAIKSGKLTGSDIASAYCERGASYNALEKTENALRDVDQAIKLAPNDPQFLACRAEVHFRNGNFDKSIADYSEAITLAPGNSSYFRERGISRFYAGRLDEAAQDFLNASDTTDKGFQAYNDLWLAWTFQRLGKPLPEAVAKRAAGPHGDWPRPALAMLTGRITPQDMLAALDRKTADDRQMALAEGYFYVGQHYLLLGDKARARSYFEKTRQMAVIIYDEHIAAKFELARLKESGEASRK